MDCRTQVLPRLPPRWPDKSPLSAAPRVATPGQVLVTTLEGKPALWWWPRGPWLWSMAQPGLLCPAVPALSCTATCRSKPTSAPSKAQWWVRQTPAQQRERRQLGLGGLEEAAEPPTPRRAWPRVPPTHGLPCKVQGLRATLLQLWRAVGCSHPATGSQIQAATSPWLCLFGLSTAQAGPFHRRAAGILLLQPLGEGGGHQAKLLLRQKGLVPALGLAAACAPGVVQSRTCSRQM